MLEVKFGIGILHRQNNRKKCIINIIYDIIFSFSSPIQVGQAVIKYFKAFHPSNFSRVK